MVDCVKCKHHYIKMLDKYAGSSDCKKGHFKTISDIAVETPKECSDFEPKGLTEEEKEIMKNLHACPVEGLKYDNGKNRMGLVLQGFSNALWEVGRVGTFGANKYSPNSWQNLTNGKERYLDALCRHLFKHLQGEKIDDESGLLHLSHLAWNALCLLEFELKENHDIQNVWENFLNKAQEEMSGVAELKREYERSKNRK